MTETDLRVDLKAFTLKNPLIMASGTCGYGEELVDYLDLNLPGALTVKGITKEPLTGNNTPRIAETPAGLLNSIGLENPGLDEFLRTKMPVLEMFDIPIIVNISGHSIEDFAYLAKKLAAYPQIAGLEVNVSCPNLDGGGMVFGTDSNLIFRVTKRVRENYSGPVIVKLSPNVTDIVEMAEAAAAGGADIISLINTLLGMAIDINQQCPLLGNTYGGLSGPAIKPVALRMVYQVARKIDLPIIGIGGIMTGEDVLEFLLAGATAVGIGTATLVDPTAITRILHEVKEFMINKKISKISDIIGKAIK